MDKDLEKQLERVRQLAARVDQIQERLAANSELITRERGGCTGTPLDDVRDFRLCEGPAHHWRRVAEEVDGESSGARHRRRRRAASRR